MTFKALHASDLHLKSGAERDYGLAVLDEILDLARDNGVGYLLLAGDIFDSFADFLELRQVFAGKIRELASVRVFLCWGNHEGHGFDPARAGFGQLENLTVFPPGESGSYRDDKLELIAPHPREAATPDPPAEGIVRFAFTHGSVVPNIFDFYQESEIGDPHVFELAGLLALQAGYYALGHIHLPLQRKIGAQLFAYPGSARVCRRGEQGPRSAILVEAGDALSAIAVTLKQAGQYRKVEVGVFGRLTGEIDSSGWSQRDWVELSFRGVVEDRISFENAADKLRRELAGKVRRLDIDSDGVREFRQLESNPFLRDFIAEWKKARESGAFSDAVYFRALAMALDLIGGKRS